MPCSPRIGNAAIGLVNIANSLRALALFTKLISLCNANFGPDPPSRYTHNPLPPHWPWARGSFARKTSARIRRRRRIARQPSGNTFAHAFCSFPRQFHSIALSGLAPARLGPVEKSSKQDFRRRWWPVLKKRTIKGASNPRPIEGRRGKTVRIQKM